jgi:hypothetical protein
LKLLYSEIRKKQKSEIKSTAHPKLSLLLPLLS